MKEILAREVETLSGTLLDKCRSLNIKLVTAESCTGGLIGALLTHHAGSSDVYERGFITYSDEAKNQLLSVPIPLINDHGAVSKEVARAMAQGALANSQAQMAISVTGIAGPGGGSKEKPIGLVYIGLASKEASNIERISLVEKCLFEDLGREFVRQQTVETALNLALDQLKQI